MQAVAARHLASRRGAALFGVPRRLPQLAAPVAPLAPRRLAAVCLPGARAMSGKAAVLTPDEAQQLETVVLTSIADDSDALNVLLHTYTEEAGSPSSALHGIAALVGTLRRCLSATPPEGAEACHSHLYVSGVGKSGAVGRRLATTLRSVGVRSTFVHGGEWLHGDLGGISAGDVVVLLSHSGKSLDIDVVRRMQDKGAVVFGITGDASSPLGKACDHHIAAPASNELLEHLPSRSVVVQEAVCNGIVAAWVAAQKVTKSDYRQNHPGGTAV